MANEAKWSDFASLDGSRMLAAANQLLPPWVAILLVVIIGWQVAQIVWGLFPAPSAGDTIVVPSGQATPSSSGSASSDVQAIAAAHMFGKADAEDTPVAQPVIDDDNLEDTRLSNLKLMGTIASPDPELSAAIITDGANEEKVYLIGDAISSNVRLHAVYLERVVLNEGGRLTNLKLPQEYSAATAPVRRTTRTSRQRAPVASESIQSVVSQNVARLADVIRPTPYFVNGQQQGYRVYPGRDRRQFAALGLRPGDLIKDIDGQSLTDPTDGQSLTDPTQAMQIFQSLGNSSQVSVTLERNGQPETVVLKTDQLKFQEEETE
jgi:general secretion pathway protein C